MAEYFVVGNKKFYGEEIRMKGKPDIRRLYKEVIPWFPENGYLFTEKEIVNKDKGDGQEQKLVWTAYKNISDYYRSHIEVEILVWRWHKEKAEITVRFKGYLQTDYRLKFKGKFREVLAKIYEDLILKNEINKIQGIVWADTNNLIDEVKRVLNLITK